MNNKLTKAQENRIHLKYAEVNSRLRGWHLIGHYRLAKWYIKMLPEKNKITNF